VSGLLKDQTHDSSTAIPPFLQDGIKFVVLGKKISPNHFRKKARTNRFSIYNEIRTPGQAWRNQNPLWDCHASKICSRLHVLLPWPCKSPFKTWCLGFSQVCFFSRGCTQVGMFRNIVHRSVGLGSRLSRCLVSKAPAADQKSSSNVWKKGFLGLSIVGAGAWVTLDDSRAALGARRSVLFWAQVLLALSWGAVKHTSLRHDTLMHVHFFFSCTPGVVQTPLY
jgi:hypothetical protein